MKSTLTRRDLLASLLALGAGAALPALAGERAKRKTPGLVPPKEPLELPPWRYGRDSAATDTVLMFRGNPSHTFYGTGPLPDAPRELWSFGLSGYETTLRGQPKKWTGTGWTGQPVKLGAYVFVGGVDRYLYAVSAEDGQLAWRLRGGEMFKSSLCVYENRLYVGNVDNTLRCVDAATGEVVWKLNTGKDLDSSPCVVDDRLYVTGESGNAWCLEPRTGEVHWKTYLGGTGPGTLLGSNGSETSPAVVDGALYAATYDGELLCVDTSTGEIRWKATTGDDTDASPVVSGDYVVIASEEAAPYVMCFARGDGRLVWRYDPAKGEVSTTPPRRPSRSRTNGSGTYGARGYWATPAVSGERVYVGSQARDFACLDLATGEPRWTTKVRGPVWSSACVVDGKVVFGSSDGRLHMLDTEAGTELWSHALGGACISTPCIVDGRIYIGDGGGSLHCFGA